MPTESAEHRLQQAKTPFADFQHYINLVDSTDSQEPGKNYRRAASKLAAIKRAVGHITSPTNAPHYGASTENAKTAAWDEKQPKIEVLNNLVKRIINSVHPEEWHSVRRWSQAMRQIGTPVVHQEGTIVNQ